MGVVFCDGLDSYGATSELIGSANWSTVTSPFAFNATNGRKGGGCVQCAPTAGPPGIVTASNVFSFTNAQLMGIAFWFKISAAPAANNPIVETAAGNGFGVNSSGQVIAYGSGSASTNFGKQIADNQWHWAENKILNVNGGTYGLWIDGIRMQDATLGMSGATTTTLTFFAMAANGTIIFDDIIVMDNNAPGLIASGMPNGAGVITTCRPIADVAKIFVPDSGTNNFSRVNEQEYDEDSSYVQSGTSGDADTYDFSLGFVPNTIFGVQQITRAKNPGAGTIRMKNRCVSGVTTSDGTSTVVPSSYSGLRTIYNQDPNTSAAWTAANLDAAAFGFTVS